MLAVGFLLLGGPYNIMRASLSVTIPNLERALIWIIEELDDRDREEFYRWVVGGALQFAAVMINLYSTLQAEAHPTEEARTEKRPRTRRQFLYGWCEQQSGIRQSFLCCREG